MKKAVVTMEKDKRGGWRIYIDDFHNGKTMHASTEGYKKGSMCVRNADRVSKILAKAVPHFYKAMTVKPRGKLVLEIDA